MTSRGFVTADLPLGQIRISNFCGWFREGGRGGSESHGGERVRVSGGQSRAASVISTDDDKLRGVGKLLPEDNSCGHETIHCIRNDNK